MTRHRIRHPRRRKNRRPPRLPRGLERVNLHAAGIDIGSRSHYVAVPPGSSANGEDVDEYGAFTADLRDLAEWLKMCQVDTVAIESTGVYWIPLYEMLESYGFEVLLVDPKQLKRVPGRKTDVLDCQWLQELHTFGLLAGAFRPDEDICRLRGYSRQRDMLIKVSSQHILHMQKALTQMNIKLREVVREVTGKTGMKIIRSILDGERDPKKLASHRDGRCKNDEQTIALALEGNWREEHLFALKQAVELRDYYEERIRECDLEIERVMGEFVDISFDKELPPKPANPKRRHEPDFDLRCSLFRMTGVDLTQIEGIEAVSALKIVSEIGTDMSRWPSSKHFGSWLGLAPGSKKTGGKNLSGKTKPSANRAATAFRLAAQSLWRSKSALGAFLRRIAARHGMPKAITATAHKLARLVYAMLKHGTEYVAQGQDEYEKRYRQRRIANLKRHARDFGLIIADPSDLKQLNPNSASST